MPFNSLTFFVFFAAMLVLHRLTPTWNAQKLLLVVGSYVFYAAWHPPYVVILLFSSALDWWMARLISRSRGRARRRGFLALSLAGNLGLLGYFKYGGFLLENLHTVLAPFGIAMQSPEWSIVLPVGISFYTFASLSYTLDVYRGQLEADSSFLDYALFVSFFPHLVAGPIVRARVLLPQMAEPRSASREQFGWGLVLVVLGLTAKVVLADNVFAPVVDAVYESPAGSGALQTWAAVLGFSGQIYYDFSGYSLCAIGLALCFGFSFPDNFRSPYAARGFSDFWRRWHVSLSTWLRDYLYISLGGSRQGELRAWRNLMITMLVGGLWHGASWLFVAWGALHGLYLVAERWWCRRGANGRRAPGGPAIATTLLTFFVVTLTWIPFRAPDLHTAGEVLTGLLGLASRPQQPDAIAVVSIALCFAAMAATVRGHFALRDTTLEAVFGGLPAVVQSTLLGVCLTAMYLCSGGDERAFIYFQF